MSKKYKHIDSTSPEIVKQFKEGVKIRSKSWSKGSKSGNNNRTERRKSKKDLKDQG